MSHNGSSETSSFIDESWISWFCNLTGNHFFCEVDKAYIEDSFNLFGLKQYLPKDFAKSLDTILDRLGSWQQGRRPRIFCPLLYVYASILQHYLTNQSPIPSYCCCSYRVDSRRPSRGRGGRTVPIRRPVVRPDPCTIHHHIARSRGHASKVYAEGVRRVSSNAVSWSTSASDGLHRRPQTRDGQTILSQMPGRIQLSGAATH